MTRTLIYIGASTLQIPAIRWAKAQGLRVIVTDANTRAPGISLADGYENISGTDVDGLVTLAGLVHRRGELVGAYCGSDFGLPAVAAIAANFDVSGPTPESVALSLSKGRALQALREANVAVPQGVCVSSPDTLTAQRESLVYPVIVKPVDSSGSRGVRTVSGPNQLDEAFEDALRYSTKAMIEQIVEGHHIDANGLFVDRVFYPCGLLSRFFSPPPFHYPVWGCEPCLLDAQTSARVYRTLEAGARALGITSGPVKADVIVSDGVAVVLEIAPRFHGDVSTSFVTPLATGHSAPNAWFAHLSGKAFDGLLPNDAGANVAGWMGIFPPGPGVFNALTGMEEAQKLSGVSHVVALKAPGYRVASVTDNLAVMGFIWGVGEDAETLKQNLLRARKMIDVKMSN